ncbi:CoA-binding domain protein [Chondrocystis sp. NIES-4102]|nr:CoA-binding domain protein [Chondrocystis sp. NIES-4102]
MNLSPSSNVIIQGINESPATFYAWQMRSLGTNIVAGISPGYGGTEVEGIPVFDLVDQALTQVGKIDLSLIFVHPYQVLDAAKEAIAAGIQQIIIFTPQVPPLDTIELVKAAKASNTLVLGPGSHGIMIPQQASFGTLAPQFCHPGDIGLIGTSDYLCYEVALELNQANLGQSIIVSLGKERIMGSSLLQWLKILNEDPKTSAIVCIAQQLKETEAIVSLGNNHVYNKPIIVYLAGLKTPQEKVLYDAFTIISSHLSDSIPAVDQQRQTIKKLQKAGIMVAKRLDEIPTIVKSAYQDSLKQ